MSRKTDSTLTLNTTWGPICVVAKGGKLVSCDMPYLDREPPASLSVRSEKTHLAETGDEKALQQASRFIRAALDGRKAALPPLAEDHAPFFRACRDAMRDIPAGKTLTYHELAKHAGSADAVRAAGQACARNPLPLFTPCHRVLASDGGLGGFSSGLAWKRYLLRVEAAR